MNVSVTFEKRVWDDVPVYRRTPASSGKQFDLTQRVESLLIRLGPYDCSDFIEIKHLEDGEIAVLFDNVTGTECILSVKEEEVG